MRPAKTLLSRQSASRSARFPASMDNGGRSPGRGGLLGCTVETSFRNRPGQTFIVRLRSEEFALHAAHFRDQLGGECLMKLGDEQKAAFRQQLAVVALPVVRMQEQRGDIQPTLFAFHDTRDPGDLFHVEQNGRATAR